MGGSDLTISSQSQGDSSDPCSQAAHTSILRRLLVDLPHTPKKNCEHVIPSAIRTMIFSCEAKSSAVSGATRHLAAPA